MKRMKIIKLLWVMAIAFSISSCEKLQIPTNADAETSSADGSKVTVLTRSTTNDIQYPIQVYAFNSSGECAGSQTINSESEKIALTLSKGNYRIIALSGTEDYSIPANPSVNSLISMKDADNYSTSPLQMGEANVTVGGANQTVNLVLSYKVATVNLTLTDIPSSVTAVSVNIAQQYSAVSMAGAYQSGKNTTVDMKKSGEKWSTGNVYVFAGASSSTVFTISLTDNNNTASYGYTYSSPLAATTPYNISGTYSTDMLSLSGNFVSEGWSSPVDLAFSFGPGSEGGGNQGEDEPEAVGSYPSAGTMWKGHLVAYVYSDDGVGKLLSNEEAEKQKSVNVLLLSLDEWTGISSAAENSKNPSEAAGIAQQYEEGDLDGWTIPSKFEATYLKALYYYNDNNPLADINQLIAAHGGTPIVAQDADGENKRFLCENGTYTFAWKSGSSVNKAGYSVTYSLRLVKNVRLSK